MKDTNEKKRIRVLVAKPGLDGHDRGAKVLVHALKEAGMEVIYTGLHNTIEQIVNVALQEDVDVVGMSIYSGAHLPLSKKLMDAMKEKGLTEQMVLVGGNIPHSDIEKLKEYGVDGVYPTGSTFEEIITFIQEGVRR
ncbi:MAG: methylmalonyl-CoA mutase [Candidatus Fischerbacteria bacterium RBG_13_37_8]|uniref:Methylmalonyl-CoA mutase n=1 Tax=Candidatus Fischerbacteria bacterium RBG_13_37_8 TaxID=1817863 RepID=A0A1F5V5V7_9BACT|nr:MAG: methylmalonyl-CoA mutase [Candidatus Fischerbacteria bacterium RBG_13_37_8]